MARTRHTDPKRWVRNVKMVSTFPPCELFTKNAHTIAQLMETRNVSPQCGRVRHRMIQFLINHAGQSLSLERKAESEKGKRHLEERLQTPSQDS